MAMVDHGDEVQSFIAEPNALLTRTPRRSTLQISSSRRWEKKPSMTAAAIIMRSRCRSDG